MIGSHNLVTYAVYYVYGQTSDRRWSDNDMQALLFFFFFLSRRHLEGSKYQGVRGFLAWQEPVGQLFPLSIKSRLKLSLSVQIGASKEGLIDMGDGGSALGAIQQKSDRLLCCYQKGEYLMLSYVVYLYLSFIFYFLSFLTELYIFSYSPSSTFYQEICLLLLPWWYACILITVSSPVEVSVWLKTTPFLPVSFRYPKKG